MKESGSNCGRKIILFADIVKYVFLIPWVIGGIAVFIIFLEGSKYAEKSAWSILLGLLIGGAVIALGALFTTILTMFMRGYGEMVENSASLVSQLEEIKDRLGKGSDYSAGYNASNTGDRIPLARGSWRCECGHVNTESTTTCACGRQKKTE